MKILFLCGSAEPGKDGVTDYTRRLCGELIREGHFAQIISLCDKKVNTFTNQNQEVEEAKVAVYRIPKTSSNRQRFIWSQEIINEFQPEWISLQFVPYSFNPKGLPFWLPSLLKKLKGNHKWHIMFHELWIGIEREVSFKKKCIGIIQKSIIKKIHKSINPKAVHTQAKIYQYYLSKMAIDSFYLPLFGNVSVTATKNRNSEFVVFVVFATIHNNSPFEDFIIDLLIEMEKINKSSKFIFIGRHGDLLNSWISILDHYEIDYKIIGPTSETIISQVLMGGDYGISSTPYKISDKSGVVAAMREHQLPIISLAKNWVDQDDITLSFDDIMQYKKGNLRLNTESKAGMNSLKSVSETFVNSIDLKCY
jgi:hypothetical protein